RLRIRQPAAGAVHEPEVPLVPGAVLVLVDDAAGDRERLAFEAATRADLDGGWRERQVGHLAHRLEIDVAPDDDGAAVGAGRLHGAGPAELDGGGAVRAGADRARHRWAQVYAGRIRSDRVAPGRIGSDQVCSGLDRVGSGRIRSVGSDLV